MEKIAIKGNRKNGSKIIKYLEKLGGDNSYMGCSGKDSSNYYFIDKDGDINWEYDLEWFEYKNYTLLEKIPVESNYELWD